MAVALPNNPQTIELRDYIDARIAELRKELEDERLDAMPDTTIAKRNRLNELKDILDRFRFPAA